MSGRRGHDGRTGRLLAAAAVVAVAWGALAFDSAAWLERREARKAEAERLRAAYVKCQAQVASPAEDVTLPVEMFPDGAVKTTVSAKKVQYFLKEGLVWAEDVAIVRRESDGTTNATIRAAHCLIDRNRKSGWAEGDATLTYDRTTFTGKGVYFSSPESYIRVFNDTDVKSDDLGIGGVTP